MNYEKIGDGTTSQRIDIVNMVITKTCAIQIQKYHALQ